MRRTAFFFISFLLLVSPAWGESEPFTKLCDGTLSYFKPMTGTVTRVDGKNVFMSFGEKNAATPGMRLKVLREGAPFIHPVTKEVLGKIETIAGNVEIKTSDTDPVSGVLLEGEAKVGDKVRISDTKVKILFYQDKDMDWYLADEYYRRLKASGRVEMIDTALQKSDKDSVLMEARRTGAEVALMLSARDAGGETAVTERLFWVRDGSKFFDSETRVGQNYTNALKTGSEFFSPNPGDAVLSYDLKFGAKLIASGDVDGDGKQEIIVSTGRDIRVYRPGNDLQLLWEIKGSAADDHLWLETYARQKNGRDGIIVTSKKGDSIISLLYEVSGPDLKKVLQGNFFVRKVGSELIAQGYSSSQGFSGDIFKLDGQWKKGEKMKLPAGVNIYDFAVIEGSEKEKLTMAYDDSGHLNLYDGRGVRIWRTASDGGGFITSFKKEGGSVIRDAGEWSVKDRLIQRQKEVLAIRRVPLLNMAKGIGYKKSSIRNYWWNGFSMEESPLVEGVPGKLMDYALSADELIVLSNPMMGIKFENVLKGESPFGSTIMIYSVKGSL